MLNIITVHLSDQLFFTTIIYEIFIIIFVYLSNRYKKDKRIDKYSSLLNTIKLLHYLVIITLFFSILIRGIALHRSPWGNVYEFIIVLLFLSSSITLFVNKYSKTDLYFLINVFNLSLTVIDLTYLYTYEETLIPILKTYWIWIHVLFAIISGGIIIANTSLSIRSIYKRKSNNKQINNIIIKLLKITFIVWTLTTVTGALWAEKAWGRYWGWDPKETWTLIIWLFIAFILHLNMINKNIRYIYYLNIIVFILYLFNIFGINTIFHGLHSYSGI